MPTQASPVRLLTRQMVRPIIRGLIGPGSASAMPLDADAAAYIAAVLAAGGTMSSQQRQAHSDFAKEVKAGGYWAKLPELETYSGGTLASAAVKFKSINGLNCVLNGYVLGDLTAAGLSNTTTKWVSTQAAQNLLPVSGFAGYGYYRTSGATPTGFAMIMGTSGGGNPQFALRSLGENSDSAGILRSDALINGSGAQQAEVGHRRNKLPIGLMSAERGGNVVREFLNGVLAGSRTSNFTPASSTEVIAVGSGTGGANPVTGVCGMSYLSNGQMTNAEMQLFGLACARLMKALGRITPVFPGPAILDVIQGQSLAAGAAANPPLSTSQPYTNMTSDGFMLFSPADSLANFLTGGTTGKGAQPGVWGPLFENVNETIASGMANTISKLSRADGRGAANDCVVFNFGVGSTAISGLAEGTNPFENFIASLGMMAAPATEYANGSIVVRSFPTLHGESDMMSTTYQPDIATLAARLNARARAVLPAMTRDAPMYMSQPSCWTATSNFNSATGRAPYAILAESRINPLIVCVGPKYHLAYVDGVHIDNVSQRIHGQEQGVAIYQNTMYNWYGVGSPFIPLRIASVSRSGAVIDVVLEGNVGNIVLDTSLVTDPSGNGTYGWEYQDANVGAAARYTSIASVAIVSQSPPTIRITLVSDPGSTADKFVSYAYTGIPGNSAGPTTGPRGCVRDSRSLAGEYSDVGPKRLCHDRWAVA